MSFSHFELQKNEPKQLKRLSRAQNRTPGRGVQFWAAAPAQRLDNRAGSVGRDGDRIERVDQLTALIEPVHLTRAIAAACEPEEERPAKSQRSAARFRVRRPSWLGRGGSRACYVGTKRRLQCRLSSTPTRMRSGLRRNSRRPSLRHGRRVRPARRPRPGRWLAPTELSRLRRGSRRSEWRVR
jgi:hypothetical protein